MLEEEKKKGKFLHSAATFSSTCPVSSPFITWEFTAANEEQNSRQIRERLRS